MDAVIETRLSDHMKYVAKFTITSKDVEEELQAKEKIFLFVKKKNCAQAVNASERLFSLRVMYVRLCLLGCATLSTKL
jgi:hypothetical protein